ncbi:hypothetical protein AYR62_04570 [Secundilactobacillus paracollinoides]|uniref:serine hydrolase n=1 Tax=Secundilactobacillus paracollinoides TaxID=240427 RepID=UPI0006D079F1|nr:serine hydrolase [Secundilactobacillus paracollinoides]ANZ63426.1 hypothetical protein AYR62_04570 [Secundilactobacillus paracollinoides]KRL75812.1 hypothetical protein FC17_GL002546 [Secundilactobacillus paracollinoides DSM 15502 = JCM 11969]
MSLADQLRELVTPFAAHQVGLVVSHGDQIILSWQANQVFPAASLIKLAILNQTLSQHPDLEAPIALDTTPVVGGAGVLQLMPSVTHLPLKTVLELMLAVSDNYAANLMLARSSMTAINEWLIDHGDVNTKLQRYLMDTKSVKKGLDNVTTAQDAWQLFRTALTDYPETQAWFAHQQFRYKLPATIDELETPITVLNKTGEGPAVDHDVARFFIGTDYYDVALLTADIADRSQAILLHQRVGQCIAQTLLSNL